MQLTSERAEIIALQVLGWLASDDDLLGVFMGASGLAEGDLRARAQDPHFLGSVLDFVLMDDAWVVAACDTVGLRYEQLAMVRAALPGGEQVHWT
ncbi:DUF3572 domain-containing protein [Roseicitreum antarcticum]|uniref:DUF3572 domain-containing protein n=1 Tax=Roseicitreum antarcticum TaxID=564137 RepID=A0A1H2XYM7_9RHOB|nr:DUF3572 domain-containing protein [Roseicitreum antarcticum]SDW97920.1 Protein of unknown function [Roseicitreum antarcticum]